MGRKFASELRAKRRQLTTKARDLQDGVAFLKAARGKAPDLLPFGLEENVIRRVEEFKEKATALDQSIRLKEISVFTYTKKKGDKSYIYWKCEWRTHNGKIKQAHIGTTEGKRGLSEYEALA